MYDLNAVLTSGAKTCEPDWEEEYKRKREELNIISNLIDALFKFYLKVNPHMDRQSPIYAFLGTLQFDYARRQTDLEKISEKLKDA